MPLQGGQLLRVRDRLAITSFTRSLQRISTSQALTGYQHPVPADVMNFQIALAAKEATDGDFVPEIFRSLR